MSEFIEREKAKDDYKKLLQQHRANPARFVAPRRDSDRPIAESVTVDRAEVLQVFLACNPQYRKYKTDLAAMFPDQTS